MIAGGGSTYTPGIVKMMLEHQEDFPLNSVTLYDNDAERQAVIGEALEILMKKRLHRFISHIRPTQKQRLQERISVWHISV